MPEKITKPSTYYPIEQQNLNKYGVSSDELYNIISENPQSFTRYFNALLEKGKEQENTSQISEFLSNINKKFGDEFGIVYDPVSTETLHPIHQDDPQYKKILDYSINYKDQKEPAKEEIYKKDLKKVGKNEVHATPRRYYGGGSYGVGGEDLPEYNWWKQKQPDVQQLKKQYPQHAEFLEQNPPPVKPEVQVTEPTKRLQSVKHEYDPNDREVTESGVVFKEPGFTFYKNYNDGSKQEISQGEYEKMLPFNSLPATIKEKYVE